MTMDKAFRIKDGCYNVTKKLVHKFLALVFSREQTMAFLHCMKTHSGQTGIFHSCTVYSD